jgi:hypothetical protein
VYLKYKIKQLLIIQTKYPLFIDETIISINKNLLNTYNMYKDHHTYSIGNKIIVILNPKL